MLGLFRIPTQGSVRRGGLHPGLPSYRAYGTSIVASLLVFQPNAECRFCLAGSWKPEAGFDGERIQMEQSIRDARRHRRKNGVRPDSFYWDTFGVLPEELSLIKDSP